MPEVELDPKRSTIESKALTVFEPGENLAGVGKESVRPSLFIMMKKSIFWHWKTRALGQIQESGCAQAHTQAQKLKRLGDRWDGLMEGCIAQARIAPTWQSILITAISNTPGSNSNITISNNMLKTPVYPTLTKLGARQWNMARKTKNPG